MEIITDINNFKALPCAATIGSFDGVHLGHRAMLKELQAHATVQGLPVMAITFVRHPRMLFKKATERFLLSTNNEKIALFESAGIDYCLLLDFDEQMATMSAECFMKEILSRKLGVKLLCIGYDHHFGKPKEGEGYAQYVEYGKAIGIELFQASPFIANEIAVSSSKIRRALTCGDITLANSLLGYDYSFSGNVVHGARIGRSLGFPTANILLHDDMKIIPADGVYAVTAFLDGVSHKGIMNIGVRPTIDKYLERTIEVHIMNFKGNIYDKEITVSPLFRIRGEMTFENTEALRCQINRDLEFAKTKLNL